MNLLMPVSITALTFATACWIERAIATPAGSGLETGFALLATLTALALLEHWLMVLPVRDSALWRWLAPKPYISGGDAPDPIDG
jgi:putative photosynthetic complex assembly protein 2